ncbi:MAG: RnfABCDGE type electron transport complex subunit D [Ruminococcaceae bacterium]|nr:RnfABCDGE type electron transport complex subunit D [Oscillospiraceae bacterium]
MDQSKLVVSPSPHILAKFTTQKIMLAVIIALVPTLVASAIIFGWQVLLLTGVTVGACVGFEALYCLIMKKPIPVGDLSAIVTGLILAFNLPPAFPLWMAIIGAFVSIVVVKQLFGGLGFNFANPALVGRIVLQLSFTGAMIGYTYPASIGGADALASATPLLAGQSTQVPMIDLLLGTHGGVLGETCALALILGGLLLIFGKVISPVIPVVYIGGVYVFKLLLGLGAGGALGLVAWDSLAYILSGGLLLGAIFMATDYVTSPYTRKGKVVFGLLLAILTVAMREWSNMLEGVSYAILLGNLLVPFINVLTRQRPLGVKKRAKEQDAGKGAA